MTEYRLYHPYGKSIIELGDNGFKITEDQLNNPSIIHVLFKKIKDVSIITHMNDGYQYHSFVVKCNTVKNPYKISSIEIKMLDSQEALKVHGIILNKCKENISKEDKLIGL